MRLPILVTGATGMLGAEIAELFADRLGSDNVISLSQEELDIADSEQIAGAFTRYKPHTVINSAAYTNVDGAETEREETYRCNVIGPTYLAANCPEGTTLVHFSTDQVFNGVKDSPWQETDEPHPLNYYAYTKWLGEQVVLKCPNALVLRVQWLYGKKKERFTGLRDKEVFTPFSDQFGAPTWTRDIAVTVLELLEKGVGGLYHFAYDDYASWAEVYEFVKRELGVSTELIPKETQDMNLPAKRPKFCVLSNQKILSVLGRTGMGGWKTALGTFLAETR